MILAGLIIKSDSKFVNGMVYVLRTIIELEFQIHQLSRSKFQPN